jgi:hypothetical protein
MKTTRYKQIPAVALAATLSATLTTGLFAVPAAEAETLAERQQRIALELEAESLLVKLHDASLDAELEPCINGAVSPRGRFATAEIERVVDRLAAGDLTEHLAESAYFRAFNDGRISLTD